MKHNKNTKRAMLASILSVMLCAAMLIGTTFAWFTDSVTSSNNKIAAGNLSVAMEWANGTEALDAASWKDASSEAIFNYDKWEPGYTEVRHVRISNKGNLALKYELNIVANGQTSKLADVIDVYYIKGGQQIGTRTQLKETDKIGTLTEVLANPAAAAGHLLKGESDIATIALKMQESAGNEYQGMSIGTDFSIQLVATQYTEEDDSFDNQYDKNAAYPVYAGTEEQLQDALTNAQDGDTIALTADMELSSSLRTLNKNITLDAQGNKISGVPMYITGDKQVIVKNAVFDNAKNSKESCVYIHDLAGTYVFENCVFENTNWDGIQMTGSLAGSELVVDNCTFSNAAQRYIHVEALTKGNPAYNTDVKVTIINSTFGKNPKGNDAIGLYYIADEGITAYNNTFGEAEPTIYICSNSVLPSISQADAIKMFTAKK